MTLKSNIDAIAQVFDGIEGKHLLDIGCGGGHLVRALAKRGAQVSGADPSSEMIELARSNAPEAVLHIAGAESLPFDDGAFDGAVIMNSLHHIPEDLIEPAIAEGLRVIRPGASFLILEPLARGGYQTVFSPIDDETEVRAMALAKIDAFIERTGAEVALRTEYETLIPEESADAILAYGLKVDPRRAAIIEAKREEVTRLFAEHAIETDRGPALDQPMIAVALRSS